MRSSSLLTTCIALVLGLLLIAARPQASGASPLACGHAKAGAKTHFDCSISTGAVVISTAMRGQHLQDKAYTVGLGTRSGPSRSTVASAPRSCSWSRSGTAQAITRRCLASAGQLTAASSGRFRELAGESVPRKDRVAGARGRPGLAALERRTRVIHPGWRRCGFARVAGVGFVWGPPAPK